jgi:hypothetical protein
MHSRATVNSKRVMPVTIVVADDDPQVRHWLIARHSLVYKVDPGTHLAQ